MFVSSLAVAAFAASTMATPLRSLWGNKVQANSKEKPSPHLTSRAVNDAETVQLPTASLPLLCLRDDLYELFVKAEEIESAGAFCRIYIAATSLVMETVTPTQTSTVNVTGIVTATANSSSTYDTASSKTCSYDSSSEPSEAITALPRKREALPLPPAQVATYPTLRLSSVCSCLVTPTTIITTMTSTAPTVYTTEMVTVQETIISPENQNTTTCVTQFANNTAVASTTFPPFQNYTAGTGVSPSQAPYNTAVASNGIPPFQNATAQATGQATGTVFPASTGTAEATTTIFPAGNNTANATATISPSGNNTADATAATTQSANSTASAGLASPTGTSISATAAYCNQTSVRGNGTFQARYIVRCGYSYTNIISARVETRSTFEACVTECDNDSRCYGISFLLAGDAQNCYIYDYYPLPAGRRDELFNSGSYVIGSNNGMERSLQPADGRHR